LAKKLNRAGTENVGQKKNRTAKMTDLETPVSKMTLKRELIFLKVIGNY